jgi:hypothetical protein
VLPTKQIFGYDNTSRQVDAAFAVEDVLVICECKVVGRSIAVERGSADALATRKKVIDTALREIDEKAQWLLAHPKGTNYDITEFHYILPLGVTPFTEFIPSRDTYYWLNDRVPRVLSPHELAELLKPEVLPAIAKECPNALFR